MAEPVDDGTAPGLVFSVAVDVDHLAVDASRVEAVITVQARPADGGAPTARAAEVLIMDRSGSMMRNHKIQEAQRAACAAIDVLPDGVLFGIIAGNREAACVFPAAGGLARADAGTKAAAKGRVMSIRPEGGTRIGRWLVAAAGLFASEPGPGVIRHAVLYSDGKNQHEPRAELDEALTACADRFVCDVRGLGDDWDYAELLHIAEGLHGDAAAVLDIADLADDFTRLMHQAGRLVVPRSYLRLRPDPRFRIASVRQAYPVQADLTRHQPRQVGAAPVDVSLGAWQEETRRYELSLRFDPDSLPVDDEVRAAVVELRVETPAGERERRADAALVVRRHRTPGFRTERPESLTQISRERDLTFTIRACVDAWLSAEPAEADEELDKALRLARELADVRLPLLERVAADRAGGGSRLRPDVTRGEMQRLGLDSRTTGLRPGAEPARPVDGGRPESSVSRVCRACGETTTGIDVRYCESCGQPFGEEDGP
jgi:Ca-activated chloride channel family protein